MPASYSFFFPGSGGKGERKFPIFAQPKLSITPIIAFSELVLASNLPLNSIYRYIGVEVSVQIAIYYARYMSQLEQCVTSRPLGTQNGA